MTFYPQCRVTHKGKHRLHDRLNNLLIVNAFLAISANYLVLGNAKFTGPTVATHVCQQPDLEVLLPIFGPLEAALADKHPDEIHVDFYPKKPEPLWFTEWAAGLGRAPKPPAYGLMGAVANMIAPIFVEFYESFVDFIAKQHGKTDNWPPLWRFARVVRNSISHGGCISITRANESAVSWYGLTYSAANNGHRLMGIRYADLSSGDLIVLMFEMSDSLDDLDVPI